MAKHESSTFSYASFEVAAGKVTALDGNMATIDLTDRIVNVTADGAEALKKYKVGEAVTMWLGTCKGENLAFPIDEFPNDEIEMMIRIYRTLLDGALDQLVELSQLPQGEKAEAIALEVMTIMRDQLGSLEVLGVEANRRDMRIADWPNRQPVKVMLELLEVCATPAEQPVKYVN